jgi:hypothetical protein
MWCLALRRDHRLWVFRGQGAEDNISIDEGWRNIKSSRKLHNEPGPLDL